MRTINLYHNQPVPLQGATESDRVRFEGTTDISAIFDQPATPEIAGLARRFSGIELVGLDSNGKATILPEQTGAYPLIGIIFSPNTYQVFQALQPLGIIKRNYQ